MEIHSYSYDKAYLEVNVNLDSLYYFDTGETQAQ